MKLKLSVLAIVSMFWVDSHAQGVQVHFAKVIGSRNVMRLKVLTDCNKPYPRLIYDFSAPRPGGPHYYNLMFISTAIGCNGRDRIYYNVDIPLPRLGDGETVSIRHGDSSLRYRTSVPQTDQDVEIIPPVPRPSYPIEYWNPPSEPNDNVGEVSNIAR
jgi:hypothetical protein